MCSLILILFKRTYKHHLYKESENPMKKTMKRLIKFTYFFTCSFFLFSNYAHAYIDPSTVTYIIQGVAGVLIAIGAAATIFRHKIKAAWRKWYYGKLARKNQKKQAEDSPNSEKETK